jgi:hypothetical protein
LEKNFAKKKINFLQKMTKFFLAVFLEHSVYFFVLAKLKDKNVPVPKCEVSGCDGVVKPDIVFFGESLPKRFFTCAISVGFFVVPFLSNLLT